MNCSDNIYRGQDPRLVSRRWFFKQCGVGLGAIALGNLLADVGFATPTTGAVNPLAPRQPHFKPKAKRVIYMFMGGAPSQFELFNDKPMLTKFNGTVPPADMLKGYRSAFISPSAKFLGPKFK